MAVPVGRSKAGEYPPTVVALMKELGRPIHTLSDATGLVRREAREQPYIFSNLKGHSIVRYEERGMLGLAARVVGKDGVIRLANLYKTSQGWQLATKEGDEPAFSFPYQAHRVGLCERIQRHGAERDQIFLERLFRGQVPEKDPWSILEINPCYIVSAIGWWHFRQRETGPI